MAGRGAPRSERATALTAAEIVADGRERHDRGRNVLAEGAEAVGDREQRHIGSERFGEMRIALQRLPDADIRAGGYFHGAIPQNTMRVIPMSISSPSRRRAGRSIGRAFTSVPLRLSRSRMKSVPSVRSIRACTRLTC